MGDRSDIRTPERPFSNGTEEMAWMDRWCRFCVHDHSMHAHQTGPGCSIVIDYLVGVTAASRPDGEPWRWPEAWLPEPDDGRFMLPSRMCCTLFVGCCDEDCTGDPGWEERAERFHDVVEYWKETTRG